MQGGHKREDPDSSRVQPVLLTRDRGSQFLNISLRTFDELLRDGTIPVRRIRGCVRNHRDVLEAFACRRS